MKLVNIADEGAKYKWQLYDLMIKHFRNRRKKPPAGNGKPGSRWKDGDACKWLTKMKFVGLAINLIDAEQG